MLLPPKSFATGLAGALLLAGLTFTSVTSVNAQIPTNASTKIAEENSSILLDFNLPAPNPKFADFASFQDVRQKKMAFFSSLAPLVVYENTRINWQRQQLISAQELLNQGKDNQLSAKDLALLDEITSSYSASWPLTEADFNQLLVKVQPIPEDLVLVQAANESAWGTSRFAKQANNFFGQWCFTQGCGLVPLQRGAGQKHEVRKFANPLESVSSYMNNLNTHRAYAGLRTARNNLSSKQQQVTGANLAPSLLKYSERGQAYVNELQSMLKVNKNLIAEAVVGVDLFNN